MVAYLSAVCFLLMLIKVTHLPVFLSDSYTLRRLYQEVWGCPA